MNLYGRLFDSLLLPAWEKGVKKRQTLERREFLEKTQWRSLDELHAIQAGALRRLLRHAYAHVPYYREKFRSVGATDADIRGPEDLLKLPILTREEARARPQDRESKAPPIVAIRKSTVDAAGRTLSFGYDRDSDAWRNAARLRGYGWAGYQLGDRVLHFWGATPERLPPVSERAKIALDRWVKRERYVSCAVLNDAVFDGVARLIVKERPTSLVCHAHAGAELARFINTKGLRRWDGIPVICAAGRLLPQDRAALETALGTVYETYGCSEVMLIGAECEAHHGLHVTTENLVVEIVITEPNGTTRPAKEGERGEVVLTDLHNLGMPFIRYANGDAAIAGPTVRCSCGRTLPRLASVEGRAAGKPHRLSGV